MIVWLASYPRSGNSFLRILLHESFAIKSYSLAGTREQDVAGEAVGQVVGHVNTDWSNELSAAASLSSERYFVKTHEEPTSPTDRCVYVVRDGRSAVLSYYHYLREFDRLDVSLDDVIDGRVYAGSWSDHYLRWQPRDRPNTLFMRYEDITFDPESAVKELADFLDLTPHRMTATDFDRLHRLHPTFFRVGSNAANIAALGSAEPRFRQRHGAVMRELGYYPA